jgi:1-acyl-sn-glycerol-3-phosphate acyltransferase
MSQGKLNIMWFGFCKFTCKVFCSIFFRISVYGKETVPHDGPLLLVSNHQSFLDPLLCGTPLKRHSHFMARDTLFKNKFLGRLFRSVNATPVRRGEADISAIKLIIEKLKQGLCVCIFPEATRTSDGKIADFKPGLGLLCRRSNATIVPVVLDGLFECWPRSRKIFKPFKKVVVSYGKPILPQQIVSMDNEQLAAYLTKTLRQMQNDCRIKQGKQPFVYNQQN